MDHEFDALTSRRSFLRGAAFAAMSTAFAARAGFASQERSQGQPPSATPAPDAASPDQSAGQSDETKHTTEPAGDGEKKPSTVVLKDDQGIEYRECPQCGFNMYRQDRTWTCENCGYSYTE